MNQAPPIILTIAGFDPSSGAGVTANIKTIATHGCYGVAAITALTVQSTQGVRRVSPVPPDVLAETLAEISNDMALSAVHIGMLGSAQAAEVVAKFLESRHPPNVVLDPVLRSTSGTALLDPRGLKVLINRLIALSAVITPNLAEAFIISGLRVENRRDMELAAAAIHDLGATAVVVTGGHLEKPADLLSVAALPGPKQSFFDAELIKSNSTHGTGCAFSTSIACHLARGRTLPEAVLEAQKFVGSAIAQAYPVGKGTGPINHLYGTLFK